MVTASASRSMLVLSSCVRPSSESPIRMQESSQLPSSSVHALVCNVHLSSAFRGLNMTFSHSTRSSVAELSDSRLAQVLHASGPDPAHATELALYAWLVGQWELEVTTIADDGTTHRGEGEIYAGWVLQGRAIQDVWMIPRLRDRKPGIASLPGAGNWYGTTLRLYDPGLDAWRILWSDPATNFFSQQIAKANGNDIVQVGPDPRGGSMRWVFSDIQPNSFRWTGERSMDHRNWRREVEIHARRQ